MYRWDGILAGSVGFASFQLVPELPRCLFLFRAGLAETLTSPASLRYFVFFNLSCKHGEPQAAADDRFKTSLHSECVYMALEKFKLLP